MRELQYHMRVVPLKLVNRWREAEKKRVDGRVSWLDERDQELRRLLLGAQLDFFRQMPGRRKEMEGTH